MIFLTGKSNVIAINSVNHLDAVRTKLFIRNNCIEQAITHCKLINVCVCVCVSVWCGNNLVVFPAVWFSVQAFCLISVCFVWKIEIIILIDVWVGVKMCRVLAIGNCLVSIISIYFCCFSSSVESFSHSLFLSAIEYV